jgi:hypothetical protein
MSKFFDFEVAFGMHKSFGELSGLESLTIRFRNKALAKETGDYENVDWVSCPNDCFIAQYG